MSTKKPKRKRHPPRKLNIVNFEFIPPEKPDRVDYKTHMVFVEYFSNTSDWQKLQFGELGYPDSITNLETLLKPKYSSEKIQEIIKMHYTDIAKIHEIKEIIRKKEDGLLRKLLTYLSSRGIIEKKAGWYDKAQSFLEKQYCAGKTKEALLFFEKGEKETRRFSQNAKRMMMAENKNHVSYRNHGRLQLTENQVSRNRREFGGYYDGGIMRKKKKKKRKRREKKLKRKREESIYKLNKDEKHDNDISRNMCKRRKVVTIITKVKEEKQYHQEKIDDSFINTEDVDDNLSYMNYEDDDFEYLPNNQSFDYLHIENNTGIEKSIRSGTMTRTMRRRMTKRRRGDNLRFQVNDKKSSSEGESFVEIQITGQAISSRNKKKKKKEKKKVKIKKNVQMWFNYEDLLQRYPHFVFDSVKNDDYSGSHNYLTSKRKDESRFLISVEFPDKKNLSSSIIKIASIIGEVLPRIGDELVTKTLKRRHKLKVVVCRSRVTNDIIGGMIIKDHFIFIEILLMGVSTKIQSKGAGSSMMDYVKYMVPKYINSIFVKSDKWSIPFYIKNGFTTNIITPEGFFKTRIFHTTDSVSMECRREFGGFRFYNDLKNRRNFLT